MSTAFVLSGGGSLGAVQVGMLQALRDRGIHPDILVGTSVGAVNAAYVAGHGTSDGGLDDLARLWLSLRRSDIFPLQPRRAVLALGGGRPSLFSSFRLRRRVAAELGFRDLADAPVPLHVVTTDLVSGRTVVLTDGDAVSAVLASAAIPGILPPVCRAGRVLVDGGLGDHTEVLRETGSQVDDVYLLPAGFACALTGAPRSALGVATQALTLLIQERLVSAVTHYASRATLHVLPGLCPVRVSPVDFDHAGELIERARTATGRWLDGSETLAPDQQRFLSLHSHGSARAEARKRDRV